MATPTEFRAPGDERPTEHPDDDFDPAAPYGRKADGTPKAKPGRPTGRPNLNPRRPAPPRPKAKRASSKPKPAAPDYRAGINGLFQLLAAPLVVAGTRSDAALADAAAVTMYGPGVADALHDLAMERPEVAAVLDRVLAAGPYGALLAAVLPLGVQVVANHGLLPPQIASALGAHPPQDLVGQMRGEQPSRAEAPDANRPQTAAA